jgi:hypothetical protein
VCVAPKFRGPKEKRFPVTRNQPLVSVSPIRIFLPVRAATTDEAFQRIVGVETQERLDKSAMLKNLRENRNLSSRGP